MANQWIIPDIHGCATSLRHLIEEKIVPSKTDELYFLGDYIDRGANVRGVLDYLMHLRTQGYRLTTLMGNHEEVLLRCLALEQDTKRQIGFFELRDSWYYYGGNATMRSFGVEKLQQIPKEYIAFIQNLEYYAIVGDYVLVHAGMNFDLKNPFEDKLSLLWAKNYEVKPHKIGGRTLIHGHTPLALSQIESQISELPQKHRLCLDNGCVFPNKSGMGHLLAFELHTQQLIVQKNLDLSTPTTSLAHAAA